MEIKYDVFISYSHADRKVAEGLCGYLEANGLRCFIDYRDIPRAAIWARVLPDAIRHSGMMVAVYSGNYNKSMQVERELSIADKSGISVLPFRLSDVPFEGMKSYYFESINWIDAFPDPEVVFGDLLGDILALKSDTDDWTRGRTQTVTTGHEQTGLYGSDIEAANEEIDEELEDDYNDGVDAMRHHEYAEAYDMLEASALANYRSAQQYLSWLTHRSSIHVIPSGAWPRLRKLADEGHPFAQYMMSRYHAFIEVDDSLSYEYAARSARQGNIFGQYELAKIYDLGVGVERDEALGIDKIKELQRMDFSNAMYDMARQYIYGYTIKKNPRRGLKILERGIELGDAQCMAEMADQKMYGDICEMDVDEARRLYAMALEAGYPACMSSLAQSYIVDFSDGSFRDSDSIKKGLEILNTGVRLGDTQCMAYLGALYDGSAEEMGLKPDPKMAVKWYRRAADLYDRDAAAWLGKLYYYGNDAVKEDEPEAWRWLKKGAARLSNTASYYLGIMCMDGYAQEGQSKADCIGYFEDSMFVGGWGGAQSAFQLYRIYAPDDFEKGFPTLPKAHFDIEGVERSLDRTIEVLRRGVNFDDSTCCYLLGCALTDPERPYSNEAEGVELLRKALANPMEPCYDAAIRLYEVYSEGLGVSKDPEKAREYLDIAWENLPSDLMETYLS